MEEQVERQEKLAKNDVGLKNTEELGKKWFKFLIYFALWAGAILNFAYGLIVATGIIYISVGLKIEQVYKQFSTLSGVDQFFGIMACAFSVYQIVIRFYLARFKKWAPKMLCLVFILTGVSNVLYNFMFALITGSNILIPIIVTIVVTGFFILINFLYFNKRKKLFKND